MDKKMSEQESLNVINEMIQVARKNLQQGAGKYFILWGYLIVAVLLFQIIVRNCQFQLPVASQYIVLGVWMLGIVATVLIIMRDRKERKIVTYTNTVVARVWQGFGVSALLLMFGLFVEVRDATIALLIMYAFALFISATAYRMKWMYISVTISVLCLFSYHWISFQYGEIPWIIALIAGNIIPGHVLNYKAKHHV